MMREKFVFTSYIPSAYPYPAFIHMLSWCWYTRRIFAVCSWMPLLHVTLATSLSTRHGSMPWLPMSSLTCWSVSTSTSGRPATADEGGLRENKIRSLEHAYRVLNLNIRNNKFCFGFQQSYRIQCVPEKPEP